MSARGTARRTRHCIIATVAVATIMAAGSATVATHADTAPAFTTLSPGQPPRLTETIPVQVVLLGYEQDAVPEEYFRGYLPNVARPIDRSRTWSRISDEFGDDWTWGDPGVAERVVELGLHYGFDHDVVYADQAYEDAFFGHLVNIGVDEADLTGPDVSLFQFFYNQQPGRALDITNNLVIDAGAVERWLVEHPAPGIDSNRNTVVLVNWWGRDDFRFHEYEPAGEPQSESGVNFAKTLWTTRLMAFGGTAPHDEESGFGRQSRTWFHDLSAGPDWRTGNWVIDDNLGFGPDPSWQTIFPPVWEYALGGAPDRVPLPDALGVITRFVAINLFFAASPLYGTDADAQMTTDVELDVTAYGEHGRPRLTPSLLRQELGDLLGTPPKLEVEHRPFSGTPARCHSAFLADERCRTETDPSVYPVDANFFGSAERVMSQWRDGSAGYEAPGFVYDASRVRKWIALADENWTDGSRSATHTMLDPPHLSAGYGTTTTMIHEYGHHFGVSHSHDGYETEWGPNGYSANHPRSGVFFFAWVGNEVNSVMSYLDINNDFSQFDVDNHQRWQAIRYLRAANMIAGQVVSSPRAASGAAHLARADVSFTAAQAALTAHDYRGAEARAADGYQAVRAAATAARVTVPTVDPWVMAAPGSWHGAATNKAFPPATEPVDEMAPSAKVPDDLRARFNALYPVNSRR